MDLNLLKQRKKELHLNYDKIAEIAELPKSTVTNIFLGYIKNPRIDTVQAIEKALGINNQIEWTDEEKNAGVGNHPVPLSDRELRWLELGSEILRVKGEDYYKTLETMIEAVIKEN